MTRRLRPPALPPARDLRATRPRRRLVFFFDLDDTLHDASHAMFSAIDTRMTAYVAQHLAVDRAEADRLRMLYWRRYGATLLGLVRHHAVDAADFLHAAHDFDVASLVRAERGLTRLFARLPGRKALLTNAPRAYADAVLKALAVQRHFGARYTIEAMRLHGRFRPKPSRLMLRAMLARERVPAARAVLVEDSRANLKAARELGLQTVCMTGHGMRLAARFRGAGSQVGVTIRSLHELPRALCRLRR